MNPHAHNMMNLIQPVQRLTNHTGKIYVIVEIATQNEKYEAIPLDEWVAKPKTFRPVIEYTLFPQPSCH